MRYVKDTSMLTIPEEAIHGIRTVGDFVGLVPRRRESNSAAG